MRFRRFALPALAASAALAVFIPVSGHAIEYPWCAQYGLSGDGGRNCGFSTFEQCLATVSGIGGFCERNSFYTGPERPTRKPRKRSPK
jgi:hypothetical protein